MVEPQAALVEFRHSYTCLAMAMVLALKAGKDRTRVRRAAGAGGALLHDRYLGRVREARQKANMRLEEAKAAGCDAQALLDTAREGLYAIEREHEMKLPVGNTA